MSDGLPVVSAIVAAYNYGDFVAETLDSALAQDYPEDRLEVVCVDDGSTDHTAVVLDEYAVRHPGRVRVFHQQNAGYEAATMRALSEARGELLALLDADDLWKPGKTAAQVALFRADPDVVLTYTDLEYIDGDGTVFERSHWQAEQVPVERGPAVLARLLVGDNIATASTIMFRREILPRITPVPPAVAYIDWWCAMQAAAVGSLDYVDAQLMAYRIHGGNLTMNAEGAKLAQELVKRALTRRATLVHGGAAALGEHLLVPAWVAVERDLDQARAVLAGEDPALPARWVEDTAAEAVALAHARALTARGRFVDAQRASLVAAAEHPGGEGPRRLIDLQDALAAGVAAENHPLAGARTVVLLAELDRLEAEPELLARYARVVGSDEQVTLAVYTTEPDPQRLDYRLQDLLAAAGSSPDSIPDALVVPDPDGNLAWTELVAACDHELADVGGDAEFRASLDVLLRMTIAPERSTPL